MDNIVKFLIQQNKIGTGYNAIYTVLGVVHILRNQPRGGEGVSKCLRLITGGGGGGGLVVDYVIKIFIFYQFS